MRGYLTIIMKPDGMKLRPSVPSPSSSTATLKLRPPAHLNFTVFKFVGFDAAVQVTR